MKKILILLFFMFLTGCADKVDIKVKKVSFLCNSDKYQNYKELGGIGQSFHPSHKKGIFVIELLSSKSLNKYPNVKFRYKDIPNRYDWEANLDKKLFYSYLYFNPIHPKELLVFTFKYNFKLEDIKTETFHINAHNMVYNELESNLFKIKSNDLIDAVKKAGFKELSENMCR